MKRPDILVFIDWYKPYFKAGGPVRSMVNMVEQLGDRIQFHIITSDRDYTATENEARVPTGSWTTADAGEQVYYASDAQRSWSALRAVIGSQSWDALYINGLYSVRSSMFPLLITRGGALRRIVAVRGMLAAGPMRQGAFKKRIYLAGMKLLGCFKDVEFQATNQEEVADIRKWIGPNVRVHLVENLARRSSSQAATTVPKRPGELRLVSLGRIAEEKNTLFAIERLRSLKGLVHFDLYGTVYDAAYLQRCQEAIAQLPPQVTVKWHGQLENDQVPAVLQQAHMLFMPSVGENFGHTMLEALVVGRPLLISDRTPWKQLAEARAGWDLPLEDPEAFERVLQTAVDMGQAEHDTLVHGAKAMGDRYLSDPRPLERTYRMFKP